MGGEDLVHKLEIFSNSLHIFLEMTDNLRYSTVSRKISSNPAYMQTPGLYRQNGNLATIQALR